MHRENIYRYISTMLISIVCATSLLAKDAKKTEPQEKAPWLSSFAVGGDLVGLSMKAVGARFANMEVFGRIGLKEKYFPLAEIGIGDCTRLGGENTNEFGCTAPYFRVGIDYNVCKKLNGNRFLVGGRYGFSSYKYDFTSPDMGDPVYGVSTPLVIKDMNGKNQWLELAVGFETRLWKVLRLGWNLRFKMRTNQKVSESGEPYYVPGYGKNDVTTFGGTVNVAFDFGKTADLKRKKKDKETKTAQQ